MVSNAHVHQLTVSRKARKWGGGAFNWGGERLITRLKKVFQNNSADLNTF